VPSAVAADNERISGPIESGDETDMATPAAPHYRDRAGVRRGAGKRQEGFGKAGPGTCPMSLTKNQIGEIGAP
jgi:hypothetical protein